MVVQQCRHKGVRAYCHNVYIVGKRLEQQIAAFASWGSLCKLLLLQMLLSHGLWVDKDASEGLVFHPKGRKENQSPSYLERFIAQENQFTSSVPASHSSYTRPCNKVNMVVELHVCIKSSQLVEWFTDFKHQIRLALKSWLILRSFKQYLGRL